MPSEEIEDLDNEELIKEYRETVEFRTEESLQAHISNRQIKLIKALEDELLSRMVLNTSNKIDIYEYIKENPNCSYSEVLEDVGENGETIDTLAELRESGEIYEPEQGQLRTTETS